MYYEYRASAVRVYNDLMGQRTDTAKLNWLVYNVGSYRIIEHSLSDRYSRNKSDYRLDLFFLLFWQQNSQGNNSEVEMTLAFNTSTNVIHRFELVK